jgi:hypothetical protein
MLIRVSDDLYIHLYTPGVKNARGKVYYFRMYINVYKNVSEGYIKKDFSNIYDYEKVFR